MSGGQCNDLARGAIRAAFHDCGAWEMSLGNTAGCDGSLILAKEEMERVENSGLKDIIPKLGALGKKYDVSMADFIQFAGGKFIPYGSLAQTMTDNPSSCCQDLPSRANSSNLCWAQR
jgi:hypothetical protein